jgi:hypothetical protein
LKCRIPSSTKSSQTGTADETSNLLVVPDPLEQRILQQVDRLHKRAKKASNFRGKTIAPTESLLAQNLEFVLNKLLGRRKTFSPENNVKNVLLFFYKGKSRPPHRINKAFTLIAIDYGKEVQNNFVML